jgi:tyrosine-protein phosphatase YwqE
MIDLHAPILDLSRNADDPAATDRVGESTALGATTLVCTPTLSGHPDSWFAQRDAAVEGLRQRSGANILAGALIDLDVLPRLGDEALRRASLAGNGRWVLVSLPEDGWPVDLGAIIDALDIRGFGVVLAAPELNESVQRSAGRLRDAIGRGALVLVSARSLTGGHGPRVRWTAANLLRNGMVHAIGGGGDVDNAPQLLEGVMAAAKTLRRELRELSYLVQAGPEEILAGGAVRPPRITPLRRMRPGDEPSDRPGSPPLKSA